jgi:hypothetical protein
VISEIVAIVCALVVGYGIGRWRRSADVPRCGRLKDFRRFSPWGSAQVSHVVTKRCELDAHHKGPHCVMLEDNGNQREEWFEDEKDPCSPSASSSA